MTRQIAYVTSRPVVNEDNRPTTAPSLEELLRSQHSEVRLQAGAGRSFSFAGTRFSSVPKVDLPAYRGRLRIFSLPGQPAYPPLVPPGCTMLEEQREAVEDSVVARSNSDAARGGASLPSPEPVALRMLDGGAPSAPVVLQPFPPTWNQTYAAAGAVAVIFTAFGFLLAVAAIRATAQSTVVAQPAFNASTGSPR